MKKLILEEIDSADVKDAKNTVKEVLDIIFGGDDKKQWVDTTTKVIDAVPDSAIDGVVDIINKKIGDKKVSDYLKAKVSKEVDADEKTTNGWQKVSDILSYVDTVDLARDNPKAIKAILIAILGVISVIEPTPVGEIITAVVIALPDNIIAKIVELLGYVTPTHWAHSFADSKANK